jgi:hypothetical protein
MLRLLLALIIIGAVVLFFNGVFVKSVVHA